MKKTIILFSVSIVITQSVFSDTRIVFELSGNVLTTSWSNDNYFYSKKIQNSDTQKYDRQGTMFGDFQTGKTYLIINKDKLLIEMSSEKNFFRMPKLNKPHKLEILLTKNKRYSSEMKKIYSLNLEQGDAYNNCDQAKNQFYKDKDKKHGYPVKITTANGELRMILKEFKTNITSPENYLTFPKGYQSTTIMEIMSKARSKAMSK